MRRCGFTLLELIVTLAVAGIIALLVYGSAQAGFDTRERLDRHRATTEAELRARTLLADALRHASDDGDRGVEAFALIDGVTSRGTPADRLVFLSRGITPPMGASALWRVEVSITSNGLRIDAVRATNEQSGPQLATLPSAAPAAPTVSTLIPEIRALDVRVMSLADEAWLASWRSSSQTPAAVRMDFFDAQSAPIGAPLIVRVGLEGAR